MRRLGSLLKGRSTRRRPSMVGATSPRAAAREPARSANAPYNSACDGFSAARQVPFAATNRKVSGHDSSMRMTLR